MVGHQSPTAQAIVKKHELEGLAETEFGQALWCQKFQNRHWLADFFVR